MSSLRSSRGYSSVTLDRLRYGSGPGSGPGVLAVGIDGVVGPTGTANLESLNVMDTATIDTAVINTLVIDDVEIRAITAVDFQTQTLEVSGTGSISQLTVDTVTGSTGAFGYLSAGGFTGNTGTFNDLTVNKLHILNYIDDVNHVSTISADYIAGVKIRAGDEGATGVQEQSQALYVEGDALVTGNLNVDTATINRSVLITGNDVYGISISALSHITCANVRAVGTVRAKNGGSDPATFQLLSDIGGTGSVQWRYEEYGAERTTMTVYPKPLGTSKIEVESTPLKAGIVGPAGVTGAIGDKYINKSLQVGGILYGTTGSFQNVTAGSLSTTGLIQGASLNVTGSATAGSLSSSTVYVDTISPFPPGSTGIIGISTGISVTNGNTNHPANAATFNIGQTDATGNSNVTAYLVGDNSTDFGSDNNSKEQFVWYSYPKSSNGGGIHKVESTPLKAGTTGPAGVTGSIGDKYFYGSVQAAGGFYGDAGSLTSLNVSHQAEILNIYTDKISPYPIGSTGTLIINGGALIKSDNTDNSANAAEITFKTIQSSIERSAAFTCVGSTGVGYGGTSNDTEQFCLYTTSSMPNGNVRTKVESTPLRAGTTGPLGITGSIGDKYFYGSVQAGGAISGNTGSFQNMTVNGLLTLNGSFVYGVQVI